MAMTKQQLKVLEIRLTQIAEEKIAQFNRLYPEPRRYMTQRELYNEFVAKRYVVKELTEMSGYSLKLEEVCIFPANETIKQTHAAYMKARTEYKQKIDKEKTRVLDLAIFGGAQEALDFLSKFADTKDFSATTLKTAQRSK